VLVFVKEVQQLLRVVTSYFTFHAVSLKMKIVASNSSATVREELSGLYAEQNQG